jgi:hypothetical protein
MLKYKSNRLSSLETLIQKQKTAPSEFYKLIEEIINRRSRAALYTEEEKKEMD